jgi:FkbM family methyltransferase
MSNTFPLKPLNILDLNARAAPVKETIEVNGQPFYFYHPPGDQTMYGTLSCLSSDKFRFKDVGAFNDGDVFLDIGSNIGLVGMVIAKAFPKARVFAFDASDIAIQCARLGAAANGLTNYQAFQVAVGSKRQKDVRFFSDGSNKSCLVAEGLNSSNPVPELTVDMISIDDIFDSPLIGINKVKMAKWDVEGAEHATFAHLFADRPDILDRIEFLHMEVHQYPEYNPDELVAKLKAKWGDKVFFDV